MPLLNSVIFEEKHYNKFYNFFSLKTLLTIVKGRRVFTNFHLILLVSQKVVYVSSVSRFRGPIVMYEYQTQWFEMHRDGEIMWI